MKLLVPLTVILALVALAACRSSGSAAPRARLAEPSGLEEVRLLAKGME